MTYSSYEKTLKQLKAKPFILKKFLKYNTPKKERTKGLALRRCKRCGRIGAHIRRYGLNLCRQCFREIATKIGFKKYS